VSEKLVLQKQATTDEVEAILEAVEDFGEREDWSPALLFKVKLAIEELALNVANYGQVDKIPEIEIIVISEPDVLTISIEDDGRPFDPLNDAPEPDLTSPIEDRPIGGLGIHFVREMMDEVTYRHEHGKNCLELTLRRME
jgi:anti-sigma regulatory factor (Ser/Thr protein kinase)